MQGASAAAARVPDPPREPNYHEKGNHVLQQFRKTAAGLAGAAALALFLGSAPTAAALEGGPVDLSDRYAVSARASIISQSGNDSNTGTLQIDLSRALSGGHHEVGGSFSATGTFGGDFQFGLYFLGATYRYNLSPIGPEENIVLYGGANLGVSIFTLDAGGIDQTEASAAGGPRFGAEYYFTPTIAVQLEDSISITEDPINDGAQVVNTLALGVRLLF